MSADSRLAAVAERQHGVVARRQALECGLSRAAVSRRLSSGRLIALHQGVYRLAGAPETWHQRLLGACLAAGPSAVASHRSAARVWRLLDTEAVEVSVTRGRMLALPGATVHRTLDLPREHCTIRDCIPVTNPLLTVVALGAVVTVDELEDALDAGLVAGLFSVGAVEAVLGRVAARGRPGVGALRQILDQRALGRARPDGLLEPRMARLLRSARLPPAEFQYEIRDEEGRFVGRVDFAWPDRRLAVEVDGYEVHGTRRAMDRDYDRQAQLATAGWQVVRFTWTQVVRRTSRVESTLTRLLATRPGGPWPPGGEGGRGGRR
jgi:very-short-patch-repair endonuclease